MRKALNQFKQFFRFYPPKHSIEDAHRYLAKAAVVDLSSEEKAFVNLETDRMLLRKTTRIQRFNPLGDWTSSLQPMPQRASAYALYTGR